MGDSNDDYDTKRSGKFRNERVNYRDERDKRNRREYRDHDQVSPKLKRPRRDWDDRTAAPNQNWSSQPKYGRNPGDIPWQSTSMMTFKQFLSSQDDAISDREAVKKYGEYKSEFGRWNVVEYFRSHKTENWFKCKYHPEECAKRLENETNGVKKRLKVFTELMENNMADVAIDVDKSNGIVGVLNAADCELGAVRIRSVGGITSEERVLRADLNFAAKIIENLDNRHELWPENESKNPILTNITDDLIDETLIKAVDRLVLYLRIVHSVDYYNPNTDEMSKRAGLMHVRGPATSGKASREEMDKYLTMLERKIDRFLQPVRRINDDEARKLGMKNREAEVEKFVRENTQELSKDKWLCPLSGKKFKDAEFVRKHIFNKHAERIEEVKTEVEFFNNYLLDPERPQTPERPNPTPRSRENEDRNEVYKAPTNYRQESRKLVKYVDLDAPDNGQYWSS